MLHLHFARRWCNALKRGLSLELAIVVGALIAVASPLLSSTAASCSGQPTYYIASMNMTIDPGAQDFVTSALGDAQASCANHFVLVMNTFGGNGNNMDNIISAISNYQASGGTFITLIAPSGNHAFSAGAYIAEASDKIYMTPGTAIGSATPIIYNIPTGEENATLTKDINGFRAYMQALASRFSRNATAAGLMVTKGVSYTPELASRLHVIDGEINATSVGGALSVLGVPPPYEIHAPGIKSQAISVLADPNISGLLFLVGTFAILADLYHPTLIVSIAGIVSIALALVGLGVFGAPIVSVVLMIIGAAFIFLELKTHHGISATVGVVVFIIGFLLVFQTPAPPAQPSPNQPPQGNFFTIGGSTYLLLGLLGAGVILGSIYLYRIREGIMERPKELDTARMVGRVGTLLADLKAGATATAIISSEEWSVTSSQDLTKGTRIKVKEVRGLKLVVERGEE